MSKKFLIITGSLSFIALFVQWGLTGVAGLLLSIVQIVLCSIVATTMIFFIKKNHNTFRYHFLRSCLIFTSIFGIFSTILGAFIIYQNLVPGAVGKIILSNGKKEIIFYQMSHIAVPHFYEEVNTGLKSLSYSGYILYAEGVRPGSAMNQVRFDTLLGIKMTDTLYAKFASTIGLRAQDQSLYNGVLSGSIKNVDISIDDIMEIVGTGRVIPTSEPIDMEAELSGLKGTSQGLLFAPLVRSVFNYFIKNNDSLDSMAAAFTPELFMAILHDRNVHIVSTLEADNHTHFVLIYGALHFQGIYDLLKTHDPNWKIISIEPLYPYSDN